MRSLRLCSVKESQSASRLVRYNLSLALDFPTHMYSLVW